MARSGKATRERILDAAESLLHEHGFRATSLERVVRRAGITKGAFFYHFDSKAALGRAVVERYAARDRAFLEHTLARAEGLGGDPLQRVLAFVGLLEDIARRLAEPYSGCLFASYVYQRSAFDPAVQQVAEDALTAWRDALAQKLEAAIAEHPARPPVEAISLADHLVAILEGSYVLSNVHQDAKLPARQLAHYRAYLEALFARQEESPPGSDA